MKEPKLFFTVAEKFVFMWDTITGSKRTIEKN